MQWAVLDLDETVLHSFEGMPPDILRSPKFACIRSRLYVIRLDPEGTDEKFDWYWGVERPYLQYFLSELQRLGIGIVIFSAAEYAYVHELVKEVFSNYPPSLILTERDLSQKDGKVYKDIEKVYQKLPGSNKTNTFMIDDKKENFIANPEIGITIPAYNPKNTPSSLCKLDTYLLTIVDWLKNQNTESPADVIFTENKNPPERRIIYGS